MGLHVPFEYLKHKLWFKKGSGIKVPIEFSTIKSQELPLFIYVQVACHIYLENFQQGLQLFFKLHLNQRFAQKGMGLQNCGSPNFRNIGITKFDKMTFGCRPHG